MNYRKRKKYWTTMLRKLNEELVARGNPFNAVLNSQIAYAAYAALSLKVLKDMKNESKNKKTA